jgi:hypothetical protein
VPQAISLAECRRKSECDLEPRWNPETRKLVGATGFEPATPCAQGRCATRLRYAQRIGGGHLADEGPELGVDWRAAHGGPAGELGPVLTKAAPLPTQDRLGGHEHEGLPPLGPGLGQHNPEEAVQGAQPGPGRRSLVHGELLTQGEVFEGKLAMAAAEDWEDSEQV